MKQFNSNEDIMEHLKFRGPQKRIIGHIMQGLSNLEIAEALFLTESGIKFQVTNIYKMTGLDSRARLMAGMFKMGWTLSDKIKLPQAVIIAKGLPTLSTGFKTT